MAVLSFSHLKKSPYQEAPKTAPESIQRPVAIGGVLSFAHLKKETVPVVPVVPSLPVVRPKTKQPILQRVLGIMRTARITAVNYCAGCPRFWPADENDIKQGVLYGRCDRSDDPDEQVWRSIPTTTTVAKCWYRKGEMVDQVEIGKKAIFTGPGFAPGCFDQEHGASWNMEM